MKRIPNLCGTCLVLTEAKASYMLIRQKKFLKKNYIDGDNDLA